MNSEASAIKACAQKLDHNFINALDILYLEHGKVIVTGIGKSGHLAKKVRQHLQYRNTIKHSCIPQKLFMETGIHQKNDPVIYLSNSGSTPELIFLEPVLRSRGAKIIGILGNINSPLGEKVDCVLDASVAEEADHLGIVPTASFMVSSSICDAIASSLMKRRKFTENDYALTHPGGQLGRNLILRVKDVMHPLSRVACVDPKDSMRRVVSEMTKHPLGASCVLKEGKLVGIISEGDLRRALNGSCELDKTIANEIMTKTPKQVFPEENLGTALRIMEKEDLSYINITCSC